jgi:Na+/proline symporter
MYCFYWGLRGYFTEKTASGYTIGGRQIPMIAFLMAATSASVSGLTTIGHPGLVWKSGLAYACVSFYALTIPLTGTLFSKRTWLLGKRYGFITPGDMYAYYFNNEGIRWLVVFAAICNGIFYTAVQLRAVGALFHWITGFPTASGAIFLAAIVWFYVMTGGLRASTWVGAVQFVLLLIAILVTGSAILTHFGGWGPFINKINNLPQNFLKIPGIFHFSAGTTDWTSLMICTYLVAVMGTQASPAFTMWQFANKNPRPFAWQQTFMSTFLVGFALFFFSIFQGLGAQILSQSGSMTIHHDTAVVPTLMKTLLSPLALGICFVGLIAAMHSTAAPFIGTTGSILLRDVWWLKIRKKKGGHFEQIWISRLCVTLITICSLIVGLASQEALMLLGGLATSFGLILFIPLLGTLWGWRFPGHATVAGIIIGTAIIFVTYYVWKYPLTIHSAVWGAGAGILIAFICRLLGMQDSIQTRKRQQEVRSWLDSFKPSTGKATTWRKIMKRIVPVWFVFAIGPFNILGNNAFSFLGLPPLWSWLLVWWILGFVIMWGLCFKAEMATISDQEIRRAEKETHIVVDEIAS